MVHYSSTLLLCVPLLSGMPECERAKGRKDQTPMGGTSNPVALPEGEQEESTLASSSQSTPPLLPSTFSLLASSFFSVWVVIMAGCPSREGWPRYTRWGEGGWVGWWGNLSPSPTGPILPNHTRLSHRRCSLWRGQSQGRSLARSFSSCRTCRAKVWLECDANQQQPAH